MWKFLFISLVIWFFIRRLMKFKFVMYKGDFSNPNNHYAQYRKPEGSITVESGSDARGSQKSTDGDYIDYEEVK